MNPIIEGYPEASLRMLELADHLDLYMIGCSDAQIQRVLNLLDKAISVSLTEHDQLVERDRSLADAYDVLYAQAELLRNNPDYP